MNWLKEQGFGGVAVWSIDMDDFRGVCGNGKFPLMKAMQRKLQDYEISLEYDGPFENHSYTSGEQAKQGGKKMIAMLFSLTFALKGKKLTFEFEPERNF